MIHGDIKPSNILVAPPNRVKLGDFGLARRASNEEGSLLKGTTKYMAPELLSAQFGAVGPASDLYSLGFTAYELMVGSHFESLLPTLATFGRNKQLAWMMWHSTADVKLPDIQRVLEGVPEDLAHVIQRLIAKDQSQRYRSAHEALRDLQAGGAVVDGLPDAADPEAEAEAAAAARRKKRVRNLSVLAGGVVVVLCLLIVMIVLNRPKKPSKARGPETFKGTISDVFVASSEIGVAPSEGGAVKRYRQDQGSGYHLRQWRAALARGAGARRRGGNHHDRRSGFAQGRSGDPCHAARKVCHREILARDDAARTIVMEAGDETNSPGPDDLRPQGSRNTSIRTTTSSC